MARMELFLFFTGMMQRFAFKLPSEHPLPETKGNIGAVHFPAPFEVLVAPHK